MSFNKPTGNTKLTQMKDVHQKLMEMQKVAVQKLQQTQEQVDSLHQLNKSQSDRINDLNSQIQQEKDKKLRNIEEFQEKMSALSRKLISARKFYKTEALQERIQETLSKIQHNQQKVQADSDEVRSLTATMEKLHIAPSSSLQDEAVPHSTRRMIWSVLEEEERSVRASLQRLQAEQQEICALLQESTTSSTQSPSAK